jgi:hypothetical protein
MAMSMSQRARIKSRIKPMNAGQRRDVLASLMNFGCVLKQIRWIDRRWFPVSVRVGGS